MQRRRTYERVQRHEQSPQTAAQPAIQTTEATTNSWESEADRVAQSVLTSDPPVVAQQRPTSAHARSVGNAPGSGLSGGFPLDDATRSFMEPRFGHDFSRIRVHHGDEAQRAAFDRRAQAFTIGRDIVFGAGYYQPQTAYGRNLIAHELTHAVQQGAAAPGAGAIATQPAPAGVAQARHLSIMESVQQFTMKIDAADPQKVPSIVETGQFYWSKQIAELAQAEYRTILKDPSWDPTEAGQILTGMDGVVDAVWQYKKEKWDHVQRTLALLHKSKHPSKNALLRLFEDRSGMSGEDIYRRLWQLRNQKEVVPELKQYRSLMTFDKVHDAEASACGFTAGMAIQKFIGKGGFKTEDADKTRDMKKYKGKGYSLGVSVRRESKPLPGTSFYIGDEVIYGGLAKPIAEIKEALDNGFVIHARVMSGWGVSGRPRLHSEHSIVIIGYDKDQFVFWDPDSGASRAYSSGFGYLFYDGKRFSTAVAEGAFAVDEAGNQADGEHRYQVLTMMVN